MADTRIICFANNKGGSGKSTTCSNVGYFMAAEGKKVLLVDGDMQLNLSLAYFDEEKVLSLAAGEKNLYTAIKKQDDLTDYILPTGYDNLDIVPSSTLMSSIEFELFSKWQREYVLKKCLQNVKASGKSIGFKCGFNNCAKRYAEFLRVFNCCIRSTRVTSVYGIVNLASGRKLFPITCFFQGDVITVFVCICSGYSIY